MNDRTPDYYLHVLDKTTDRRGQIGAAWKHDDGRISILLNPCVVLQGGDTNILLTLFRAKKKEPDGRRCTLPQEEDSEFAELTELTDPDEIPF